MIIAYRGVNNAASIVELIASIDQRVVVIDLSFVVSSFHIQLAVYKALLNESQGRMKTKSIQSEVLYQLSSSTKISEAILQYSLKSVSTEICFIYVPSPVSTDAINKSLSDDTVLTNIEFKKEIGKLAVDGTEIDSTEISSAIILTAEKSATIVKYFKITPLELEVSGLEESVSTRLAVKDNV